MRILKKTDLVLLGALLVIALALFLFFGMRSGSGVWVSVRVDGVETERHPLSENGTYKIESGDGDYNILTIEDGSVSVTESNCRNQICVNTGKKTQAGEIIVCLPHKVVIVLESEN